jgi:hypothetical protein
MKRQPLWAGLSYAMLTFSLGFVLGTLRTLALLLSPGTPRLIGVFLEVPFMLAGSWLICSWQIRAWQVAGTNGARLVMGLVALVVLLGAEVALGTILFQRTLAQHVALYSQASYLIGLIAQVIFATFPLLQISKRFGAPGN